MGSRAVVGLVGVPILVVAMAAPAFGVGGTSDVQANDPQVEGDAGSNDTAVFPTNKQNEPSIASNPIDRSHLIAGANDEQRQPPCGPGEVRGSGALLNDCGFFPGVGTAGVYTSADGGTSWDNQGLLDDQSAWPDNVISDGDPVIAYGPRPDADGDFSWDNGARAYYATLATVLDAKGFEYVVVSHSDDDGQTWSSPVIGTTKTSAADFNDKNWLAVDTSPTSKYFGQVYLSWTEFRSATFTGFGNEPMMIAASSDGGETFGAPKQLSPAGNNLTGNGRQGSSIAVGSNGTVYVAFEQGSSQVLTMSTDGGRRWTRPRAIGSVVDIHDPIPGANFRTDSFPTIAADPGSSTVYVSWATRTTDGGRIVVTRSLDGGFTWSAPTQVSGMEGYAFFQGLDVAPNGRVDIAYQVLNATNPDAFGTGIASIGTWATSSSDGGATWSDPIEVSTASSDPAVSAQNNLERQFWGDYNTLDSDDSGAWFVFTDSRRGTGCPAVDAYQQFLLGGGGAIHGDGFDRFEYKHTGVNPALADPGEKPAPQVDCPEGFGDTDIRVVRFTP